MKAKVLLTVAAIYLCAALPCCAQAAPAHIGEKAQIFEQVCSAAVLTSTADKMPILDEIACGSYVEGLANGMSARDQAQSLLTKKPSEWPCFTSGVTPQELIGVVLNFLSDHPEMRDSPTGGVAALAFMHKFPCK